MGGVSSSPRPATGLGPNHRQGLRFKKLDLQMHTPASQCFADKAVKPEDIVKTSLAKGLAGIGVTDHNSGEWIDLVKAAAEKTNLVVFAGKQKRNEYVSVTSLLKVGRSLGGILT